MEDAYWSLIDSTQGISYQGFVDKLRSQPKSDQVLGRAAIFESRREEPPFYKKFRQSKDLGDFLDKHPNGFVRRVIVLEDLPRNFIEVLGSRLRIPPSFFGDHWEDPEMPFKRRTLRHQDPCRRFMLNWRKLHRQSIITSEDDGLNTYAMVADVARTVSRTSLFGDPNGVTTSGEKLSFWSVGSYNSSWTG